MIAIVESVDHGPNPTGDEVGERLKAFEGEMSAKCLGYTTARDANETGEAELVQ